VTRRPSLRTGSRSRRHTDRRERLREQQYGPPPGEALRPLHPGQATAAGVLGFVTVGLTTVFSLVLLAGVLA
jgi:hypothetical protein